MLTKECLEELETDGCFIRLLARRISQSLFRTNDLIYKKNDYGSEVIITRTLETYCATDFWKIWKILMAI